MPWQMESPRPMARPTGRVVKNGSKIWPRCSGAMPTPLSCTSMNTRPAGLVRVTRRMVLRSAMPSGSACAALSRRLMNTCPRRASSASTAGTHW